MNTKCVACDYDIYKLDATKSMTIIEYISLEYISVNVMRKCDQVQTVWNQQLKALQLSHIVIEDRITIGTKKYIYIIKASNSLCVCLSVYKIRLEALTNPKSWDLVTNDLGRVLVLYFVNLNQRSWPPLPPRSIGPFTHTHTKKRKKINFILDTGAIAHFNSLPGV